MLLLVLPNLTFVGFFLLLVVLADILVFSLS